MKTPVPIQALLAAPLLALVGRVLLTLPFWLSGIGKFFDLPGAFAEARHFGLDPVWLAVAATIAVQVGCSLMVIAGRMVWFGAGALGVFTFAATLLAHPYWQLVDPVARFHERNMFLEHLGLIGGFVLVSVLSERKERNGLE